MVRITNGFIVANVTSGAYNNLFKGMGYKIIGENYASDSVNDDDVEACECIDDNSDEKFVLDVVEKPIGEWNKEELKKFARIKRIDISGMKPSEAKNAIAAFINNE